MNERINEAFQLVQRNLARISDLDGNITRSLTMSGAFLALISLSVKITRWQEALFVYFDVAAIILFFIALHPRKDLTRYVQSAFYYEKIAEQTKQEFLDTFDKISDQSYLDNLKEEIYISSRILSDKERWFDWGMAAMSLSLLCWIFINIWAIF